MRKYLTAAAAALSLAAWALPASAQGLQDGQQFGDWVTVCPQGPESCQLTQTVVNKENNQGVLLARVGKVKAQDGQTQLRMMLIGPLGVLLPQGVAVQIDEQQGHRVPFLQCGPQGCNTIITLDDKTLTNMKAGQILKVGMTMPNGEMGVVGVSLKGFTAGVAALQ